MEEKIRMGNLLAIYGELLPSTQREVIALYCNEDLSLSEISENVGITRQGAHDKIRRGEKQLTQYEECLHIEQRNRSIGQLNALVQEAFLFCAEEHPAHQALCEALRILGGLTDAKGQNGEGSEERTGFDGV